ncbi:hypothetical protein E2R56_24740 [Rhodococcus qingshengii]|nr:hypothetical protein E2R56_24740 [Rhodococcus qingshengii]
MSLYERLPSDFLIQFYNEVKKMSSNGLVSKSMYYELGLIIAAASKRGIQLDKPKDFEQNVDHELLLELKCRNWIIRKPNKKATENNDLTQ